MIRKEFKVEVAKKSRKCLSCASSIGKDEACLVFNYGSSYYSVTANLCRVCILNIQEEIYQANLYSFAKLGIVKTKFPKLVKTGGC